MIETVGYAKDDDLMAMSEELHKFANRLAPIVNMVKLDNETRTKMIRELDRKKKEQESRMQQRRINQ